MRQNLKKRWSVASENEALTQCFIEELQVYPVVAKLLVNRGFTSVEEAREFLTAQTDKLLSPFELKGMTEAIAEIENAILTNKKIVVYGDYDVDGITATSVLYRFLNKCGANVSYYIPERQSEGYGLNLEALEQLIEKGVGLVISVDCGISSADIVAQVKARLPMIITDHHNPPSEIPDAVAVINPKQPGCPYKDKVLAGVGVAFKLCQGYWAHIHNGEVYLDDLDIVALGTIADVVPLVGENRILVREGLAKINSKPNIGIQALVDVAGLTEKTITSGHVGFTLAPRLNAAGRVTHATRGVELLTSKTASEAAVIAEELQETNIERQRLEREIHESARKYVAEQGELADNVLVVAGEGWHPGVIGIVASRLVEEFYKPTMVISINDGIGKGSCRSIENCDIYEALKSAEDLLLQFGGHKQAAGFSIEADKIDLLRQRLIAYCKEHLTTEDYIPIVGIDAVVDVTEVAVPVIDQIATLEPYGMGNSTPVFAIKDILLQDMYVMGQQKNHCKFIFDTPMGILDGIAWQSPDYHTHIFPGERVKVAFSLQKNEWQGRVSPQLMIQDVSALEEQRALLTDEGLRVMYVLMKSIIKGSSIPKYILEQELIHKHPADQTEREAMLAIEVFKELGIIKEEMSPDGVIIYQWCQIKGKLDLVTSLTFLKYSA